MSDVALILSSLALNGRFVSPRSIVLRVEWIQCMGFCAVRRRDLPSISLPGDLEARSESSIIGGENCIPGF